MNKKAKFEPKNFSLVILNTKTNSTQKVEIPFMKSSNGKTFGGKATYLMAIDSFTCNFENDESLLNYIRQNSHARINSFNNQDLQLEIGYNGKDEFTGNKKVVYKTQTELIEFIHSNQISSAFDINNPYVKNFQQSILEKWNGKDFPYMVEYRKFITNPRNGYYNSDLAHTLLLNKDRINLNDNMIIGPTRQYHNLRADYLLKPKLHLFLEEIERSITPFNERSERNKTPFIPEPEKPSNHTELKTKQPKTKLVRTPHTEAQIPLFEFVGNEIVPTKTI